MTAFFKSAPLFLGHPVYISKYVYMYINKNLILKFIFDNLRGHVTVTCSHIITKLKKHYISILNNHGLVAV